MSGSDDEIGPRKHQEKTENIMNGKAFLAYFLKMGLERY
jgi:hypothetical protein